MSSGKKIILLFLLLLLLLPGCAPRTREEFLETNNAVLGANGQSYSFDGELHQVVGAVKSKASYINDKLYQNVVVLLLQNDDNTEQITRFVEQHPEYCYPVDIKNKKIEGSLARVDYGDTAQALLFSCSNVEFEDIKYLILDGVALSFDGAPQTILFPLWDAKEQPLPEPIYEPKPEENGPEITLEEYERIKTGMKYITVKDIIGGPGELLSDIDLGFSTSKAYIWYGADGISTAIIYFIDGDVSMKTQVGLT